MKITADKEPRLQVGEAEPFPIGSARVEWEADHSLLRDLTDREGKPLRLPVAARVTLYTGPSVVFVGEVQEDRSVLDLLSCQDDDGEFVDF